MSMIWECDECGDVIESDPTGHTDFGGKIEVQGPRCKCNGVAMTCLGEGYFSPEGYLHLEGDEE